MRQFCLELAPTVDNNLVASLLRLMDCFLSRFVAVEGQEPPSQEALDDIITYVEEQFILVEPFRMLYVDTNIF